MKLHAIEEITFFQIIKILFFFIFLVISFLILAISPLINYMCKKTFLFSNITLLIFDVLVLLIIFFILRKFNKTFSNWTDKYANTFILICSMILFFSQIFISYNICFLSGWDAGGVFQAAQMMASGSSLDIVNGYFSTYSNNLLLTWIYSIIMRVDTKLDITHSGNGLALIIIINCFVSSLSSILTYKSVKELINKEWAVFSWIIYFLLIGTSPWFIITYSDPFALFLPILIFFIYTRDLKGKGNWIKWVIIGIISFLGYHIKPQVIIILIAIIIIEMWRFFFSTNEEKKKKYFMLVITLIFTFFISSFLYKSIYRHTGLSINNEKAFGLTHFAMMGLNDKRDGVYSDEDVEYSGSFTTSSERKKANIEVIKERLNNFGILGYMKFLSRKTLVNYGDGSFAWGIEGNFYFQTYPNTNGWFSPLLKSFYYTGGDNYDKTSTFEQAVWIGVIISMLGLIFTERHSMDNKIAVLMLSILGLTTFELIFEARARYLYIYTPIYITLSMIGLKNIIFKITNLKQTIY